MGGGTPPLANPCTPGNFGPIDSVAVLWGPSGVWCDACWVHVGGQTLAT